MRNKENKRKLLKNPWGYKESILLSLIIILTGTIIEIITKGKGITPMKMPFNIITGLIFIAALIYVYLNFNKKAFYQWLSGIPSALTSIVIFCILTVLIGILPQNKNSETTIWQITGLNHIQRSWPFFLSGLYLMIVLGFTILRRLKPINKRNIGFFLNHAGLWITLFAFIFGSGDIMSLKLKLFEGTEAKDLTIDKSLNIYRLPFKVKLIDFDIDEYPPEIVIINRFNNYIDTIFNENEIKEGLKIKFKDYVIEIIKYLNSSKKENNTFIASEEFGSLPSAYLKVTKIIENETYEGWIAPTILDKPFEYISIDSIHAITLNIPKPKIFRSVIEIYNHNQLVKTTNVIVNKPFTYKGFKIYQMGYEEKMGKWSQISIFEIVYDPWLILVYIGLIMLIFGSVYLIWNGKSIKN